MSTLSDILDDGLNVLSGMTGDTAECQAPGESTWVPLVDAVFHNDGADPLFDVDAHAEAINQTAHILVPVAGTVMATGGWKVRINGDDDQVWAVVEGPDGAGMRNYRLNREAVTKYGADRKGTRKGGGR